jgi:hypothetical protein
MNDDENEPKRVETTPESLHCPRARLGRVETIFSGPDLDPQGWATRSLALAPGQESQARAGSGPTLTLEMLVANKQKIQMW